MARPNGNTRTNAAAIGCQVILTCLGLSALAFMPAAGGDLLVLSIGDRSGNTALRLALAHGGRPVGPGPVPGSVVVRGDRDRLRDASRGLPIFILAAPRAGCGSSA
ncbi:MAG: hypothetical protein AAF205_13530 [Pseudomonadota bacterium]